jgi:hypothetical protein
MIKSPATAASSIFVFGSNLAGRHGKGAALTARLHYGAIYGQGEGLQGRSYGIPTKGAKLETLSLNEIKKRVDRFIIFAKNNPQLEFRVTAVGTGLAAYKHDDIAPMFYSAPINCILPRKWKDIIPQADADVGRRAWWVS